MYAPSLEQDPTNVASVHLVTGVVKKKKKRCRNPWGQPGATPVTNHH